jgi:exodeoxyribonuclease V alpha subunit
LLPERDVKNMNRPGGAEAAGFESIDLQFGDFINRVSGNPSDALWLGAALVSRGLRQGHTCIDINIAAGADASAGDKADAFHLPEVSEWLAALRAATNAVGAPGDFKPLILDAKGRLYLQRYWQYENELARCVRDKAGSAGNEVDGGQLGERLAKLFPEDGGGGPDMQKVAAFAAVRNNFCVISGGPGTGKTTTVMKILALLLSRNTGLKIALAAPTGKAAARLEQAVSGALEKSGLPAEIAAAMPNEAHTIHALLGARHGSPRFRRNRGNPLPHDVVVVDEASMVDLALMSKLLDAVRPEARLILLGDKDQLASVEAGCVLGDLFDGEAAGVFSGGFTAEYNKITKEQLISAADAEPEYTLADSFVLLNKSHRFSAGGAIEKISGAINTGDGEGALELLKSGGDARWTEAAGTDEFYKTVRERVVAEYGEYLNAGDAVAALAKFEKFRILCALREGPRGVETLNRLAERALAEAQLISGEGRWYAGRPVMITRNDYNVNLFNGDIGIVLPDPGDGGLRAFFPSAEGAPRGIRLARLPAHETAFAMTIHKSQGSEFDGVLMVLPPADSKILTCELLYTGVTRCRERVEIIGNTGIFIQAVKRRIARYSGLHDALWKR